MQLKDEQRENRLNWVRENETDLALIARLNGLLKTSACFNAIYSQKKLDDEQNGVSQDFKAQTLAFFKEGAQPAMFIDNDITNYVTVIRERYEDEPENHKALKNIYETLQEACEPLGTNQRWHEGGRLKTMQAIDAILQPKAPSKSLLSRIGLGS